MLTLINDLIDSAVGDLAALLADNGGVLYHVVPVDDDLLRYLAGGEGAFDLPLAGVVYGGDEADETDASGRAIVTRQRLSIILVVSASAGVDGALTGSAGLYALVGQVKNALAGKSVLKRDRDGVLLAADGSALPEGAAPVPVADAWFYEGNEPFDVGSSAEERGLMGWAVHFQCLASESPVRADTDETETIEGADIAIDNRPDADPATPDADKNRFTLWDEGEDE